MMKKKETAVIGTTKELFMVGMRFFEDLKKARWYARENGLMVISSNGGVIYDYRD